MRRRTDGVILLAIAAGAVALAALSRFHHDLAIDEPFTALAVASPATLDQTLVHDNVPFFYALLLAWTRAFGASAFALRAMSTAAFGGTILFSAAAARRIASTRAAWLTAVLTACSVTFGLQPAATARPYALAALFAAMALWAAMRVSETMSTPRATAPVLASHLLGLFTHPVFVFVSAASAAAGLTAGGKRRLALSAAPVAAIAIYLAIRWPSIRQTVDLPIRTWMTRPSARDLLAGWLVWGDHSTPILAALLVVLLALWRARRSMPGDPRIVQPVIYATVTAVGVLAGTFAVSQITPVYLAARTPIFVLPSIALVLGVAIAELAPAIVHLAVTLLVVSSAVRYTARSWRAPDPFPTRASLAAVAGRAACGDTIVAAGLSYAPIVYYASAAGLPACVRVTAFPEDVHAHPGWLDLSPQTATALPAQAAAAVARLPPGGHVWVLAQSQDVGKAQTDVLVRELSRHRRLEETLPLPGSFFSEIVAFGPAAQPKTRP